MQTNTNMRMNCLLGQKGTIVGAAQILFYNDEAEMSKQHCVFVLYQQSTLHENQFFLEDNK
jgi:hypothetical protein